MDITVKHTVFAFVVGFFVAIDVSALTLCSARSFQRGSERWLPWAIRHGATHALFLTIGIGIFAAVGRWLGPYVDPLFRTLVEFLSYWTEIIDWPALTELLSWCVPFLASTKNIIALLGVGFIGLLYHKKLVEAGRATDREAGQGWRILTWLKDRGYGTWAMTIYVALDMNYVAPMIRTTLENDQLSLLGTVWFVFVVGTCVSLWAIFWWLFGRLVLESKFQNQQRSIASILFVMALAEPLCCYYITVHVVAESVFGVDGASMPSGIYLGLAVLWLVISLCLALGRRAIGLIYERQSSEAHNLLFADDKVPQEPTREEQDSDSKASEASVFYGTWQMVRHPTVAILFFVWLGQYWFLRRFECFSKDSGFWSLESLIDLIYVCLVFPTVAYAFGQCSNQFKLKADDKIEAAALYLTKHTLHAALFYMLAYVGSALYFIPMFWSPDGLHQWMSSPTLFQQIWLFMILAATFLIVVIRWLQFIQTTSIPALLVMAFGGGMALNLLQFFVGCVLTCPAS